MKQQKSKRKADPKKKVKPLRIKIIDTMRKIVEMRREEQAAMPVKTGFIFSKGDLRSKGHSVTRNTVFTEFSKIGREVDFFNGLDRTEISWFYRKYLAIVIGLLSFIGLLVIFKLETA